MRKLSWMIAAVLSTLPAWAGAVELGKAQVDSHLTEHLKVVIPLTGLGNTPLEEVKVRLAPQKFYDQSGLSLDSLAGNITFEIKQQGKQPVVIVHSKRIVTDPILSLLLEVSSGESQVIKEYDLLLNPPTQGLGERATNAPSSLTGSKPAQTRNAGQWQTVQNVPDVNMGGSYQVQRGDTLYDIARRATGDSKAPVRGMMQAIINANPSAFVDGNGNALRSGVTLKVPTAAAANATPAASTAAPAAAAQSGGELPTTKLAAINTPDNAAATAPASSQPKLELLSAEPKSEPAEPATTAPTAATEATAVPATGAATAAGTAPTPAATTGDAATTPAAGATQQTDEAIASIDAKSTAMSKQIEMLNEQLKQVQGLVTERNQNIVQLQQKVKQSEEQTQQIRQKLESNTENFWAQWGPYLLGGAGLLIILLLLIAVSRGRRQKEWEEAPATIYAPTPKKSEPSVVAPVVVPVVATSAVVQETVAPSVPVAPQFNSQSVIDESRLLVSYNLGGQAVSTLQEAIHQQPNELALYQELARLHSENHDTYALNQVVAQIEEKFGADHVPNLPAADEISAMHGAVNIFDTSYDAPAPEVEHHPAEPESKASSDFLDDIPSTAFGSANFDKPLSFDVPTPEPSAESTVLDFDMDSLAKPTVPAAQDDALSLDLTPHDGIEKSVATIEAVGTDHRTMDLTHHDTDPATDTRLGLVEAFLSVGDKDSYEMIADEIRSEGNSALINHLQEIERKFGHG